MKKIFVLFLFIAHQSFAQTTTGPYTINNGGYGALILGDGTQSSSFVLTKEATDNSFNIWSGPFGTGSQMRLKINNTTGNIGLGQYDPQYRMDIWENATNGGMRIIHNNSGFTLLHSNSLTAGAYNGITKAGDAGLIFGDYNFPGPITSYGFVIAPWSAIMGGIRMDEHGRVGINTQSIPADYQFGVNGSAIFDRVVVKQYSNWSDYVFDDDYRLMPLEHLKRYVETNHHLPEIPSADSVAKAGVDVGANQAALLKKIEELTLYIIQLNEKIDRLEKKAETPARRNGR